MNFKNWLRAVGLGLALTLSPSNISAQQVELYPTIDSVQAEFMDAETKRKYELVDYALENFGDRAGPFLSDILNTENYQSSFPTDDVYHVFRRRLAVKLGKFGSDRAVEALSKFYYTGSREVSIDRTTPYIFKHEWQEPVARTVDESGIHYAIIPLWWYGSHRDLWLTTSVDQESWSNPVFIGVTYYPWVDNKTSLSVEHRRFELTYPTGMDAMQTTTFYLEDLFRDSDRDGLTDIEETRFGLNHLLNDTDSDGLLDGVDANPLAVPREDKDDFFYIRQAIIKLHARPNIHIMLVQASSEDEKQEYLINKNTMILSKTREELEDFYRKVNDYRGEGRVMFQSSLHRFIFKGITVYDKQSIYQDTASVNFTDYQGPIAAGFYNITLRKINRTWVVVEDKLIGVA